MKLKIIVDENAEDEITIRCGRVSDEIKLLQDVVNNVIEKNAELALFNGNKEYFIPKNEILFFETDGGRTAAHTADRMLYSDYKLYELEHILPHNFIRVSKSCILNATEVSAVTKNLTGSSEVEFRRSTKRVYVSRGYFKMFKSRIDEIRSFY